VVSGPDSVLWKVQSALLPIEAEGQLPAANDTTIFESTDRSPVSGPGLKSLTGVQEGERENNVVAHQRRIITLSLQESWEGVFISLPRRLPGKCSKWQATFSGLLTPIRPTSNNLNNLPKT